VQEFDLVVIGGGSAGLKAARTASRMGHTVAVAEERELGGECFWAGCVPTKAMVRAAQVWEAVKHAAEFGIHIDITRADFAEAMAYKDRAVHLVEGDGPADGGLKKAGIGYYHTRASFESPHEIRVGEEVIYGKQIIIATGTVPAVPPIPGLAEAGFITNREAVNLTSLPKRIVILGAGPIGLEFAQIFRRFGSEVTVLAKDAHILPREDKDICKLAAQYLHNEGIRLMTEVWVEQIDRSGAGGAKRLKVVCSAGPELIECDEILIAIGRAAAVEGMNLAAAGLESGIKALPVDKYLRTSVSHIWAAGDIAGGPLFTHVASYEGKLVAMNAFGDELKPFDHRVIPRCTYIDPEVASVGITEEEAHAHHLPIVTRSFPFEHLDRAIIYGNPRGIVKLISDANTDELLGAHLIGHEASSLLAELVVVMQHRLPVSAISDAMHAYPSFPEAVESAALSSPKRTSA